MAFSAVAVLVRHNFEYFDFRVDVLNKYSFTRNTPVFSFLFLGEFATFWFLFRRFTVPVNVGDSLISAVHLRFYAIKNTSADCILVQLKIMRFSGIFCDTDDFLGVLVDDYLGFYGVLFLFSGVPLPLFFLGRSIGHSVTSTRITSMLSSSSNAFLPGNLKFSSLTSVFSTHSIVS